MWRTIFICLGATLVPIGCTSCREANSDQSETPAEQPAIVRTAPVIQQDVVPQQQLVGTVVALRHSTVGSPVSGRVVQVNIEAGDHVEPPAKKPSSDAHAALQPMVQLDKELIDLQIKAAEAELLRLEQVLKQRNAGNRPEEVMRAKSQFEAAEAASQLAVARLARAQQLSATNSISEDELEAAQAAAVEARHALAAAQADYQLMSAGYREEEIAQAAAEVAKQRHELARLNVERTRHDIFAPFDGFVVQKLVDVGEWLAVGDPVAELVALDPIGIRIHVPENLVNELRIGDQVRLQIPALPADQQELEGTIRGIAPSADVQARTFAVRVRVANPRDGDRYLLRDGMQAHAVVRGSPRSATLVPKDALVLGDASPYVMVVRNLSGGKQIAARVDVQVGEAHDNLVEVTGDLQPSQLVIVRGNDRVQAGQVVKVTGDTKTTK